MDEFDFSRLDASEQGPEKVVAASPAEQLQAMFRIAMERHKAGDLRSAAAVYEEVLRRDPKNAEALYLLGLTAFQAGQPQPAIDFMSRAIALKPDSALMHANRGRALAAAGRFEAAVADYDRAIALEPDLGQLDASRGAALQGLGRLEEALASYDRALEREPAQADALSDRGALLRALGRRDEALASYDHALALDPRSLPALFNRGGALRDAGRVSEAVESYSRALEIQPELAIAHHNRALCRLQLGEYPEGFAEYEWRKRCPTFVDPRYGLERLWQGEPLAGKALYVFPELYQGDVIQFARFALAAEQAGARVHMAAPRVMHALLQTMSPSIVLLDEDQVAESYDVQAPLLSLPHGLGTSLETLPPAPYLRADPTRVARWRETIGLSGLKVGVVWQGSTAPYALPLQRSFPLAALQGLAGLPDVRLISLQKINGLEQLGDLPKGMAVQNLGDDFDPGPDVFVDTAAAMTCCDLVVTPDTSVAHLAGALGINTWVALPAVADWRWMSGRSDSPWYPTMRLFRQTVPGDWTGVFADITSAVAGIH